MGDSFKGKIVVNYLNGENLVITFPDPFGWDYIPWEDYFDDMVIIDSNPTEKCRVVEVPFGPKHLNECNYARIVDELPDGKNIAEMYSIITKSTSEFEFDIVNTSVLNEHDCFLDVDQIIYGITYYDEGPSCTKRWKLIGRYRKNAVTHKTLSEWKKSFKVGIIYQKDFETWFTMNVFEAQMSGYKGNEKVITIPHYMDEYVIRKIKNGAFQDNQDIEEVIIEEGIQEIGNKAFYNCKNLKKIVLPKSLKSIGKQAFQGCPNLETPQIDDKVKIGKDALDGLS